MDVFTFPLVVLGVSVAVFLNLLLKASVFFGFYVAAINIYRVHLLKKMPLWGYVLGGGWVIGMLIIDVSFQYTVFSALYREWPPRGEWTVTQRLSRWKKTDPESLRGRWSLNICKLLNLFTPADEPHC